MEENVLNDDLLRTIDRQASPARHVGEATVVPGPSVGSLDPTIADLAVDDEHDQTWTGVHNRGDPVADAGFQQTGITVPTTPCAGYRSEEAPPFADP